MYKCNKFKNAYDNFLICTRMKNVNVAIESTIVYEFHPDLVYHFWPCIIHYLLIKAAHLSWFNKMCVFNTHDLDFSPQYNWNIFESAVKHYNPKPDLLEQSRKEVHSIHQ